MSNKEELIETLIVLRTQEILSKDNIGRKQYIQAIIEYIETILKYSHDNKNKD